MWKHGFTPVYRSKMSTGNKWRLFNLSPVKIYLKKKNMTLQFDYPFKKNERVEFALTYPYSYEKYTNFIKKLKKSFKKQKIQFSVSNLIESNQNRKIHLLWLSGENSKNSKNFEEMKKLKNLFPEIPKNTKIFIDKKKCKVIMSARVHPSETASNYVLEGFLNYLAKNP